MSAAGPAKPTPPPFPAKGTKEYDDRLQRMREGHAARLAKKQAQEAQQKATAPPVEAPDLIDVGDPKSVRMAPEPRPEKPAKGKASGGSKGKGGEFEEKEVHAHIKMGLDILARMPGHEHWQRADDEVSLIAEPATRCLNRMDRKLLERLRTVSDPAALIFACVMVLGPSIVEEVRHIQPKPSSPKGRQQLYGQPGQRQQPSGSSPAGSGGIHFPDPANVSANGAAVVSPPADLPSIGI